ncbi:MAG TPA: HDIG domain-containing protein [Blastocatellia bacterium]|nr:HDIG domain-containing protein [Blastocatellia bacterium]HMV82252.1 HDIG domain-containing protein [Blastocatellia bacterium]HMX27354.1 HDIG domain-containing protein [Blastocatellia bacterium]HMY70908.1 HDIG domain-containing protein [Blastocatellia bacterium]HMZ21024.1 HDIG domain-containing protein [Blastocatellia bacterium]
MPETLPSRESAWQLLCEWTQSESLRKHARAVEHAMRTYARKYGQDEHTWGITGMLHDFDYERYPDQRHPQLGSEVLREAGYPEEIIRAILSHADYTGVARESLLEHALFAADELCGFLTACALVRPDKSFDTLTTASVKKRMKDKAFARTVNRDDLWKGAEELGLSFDEHCAFVIAALREIQTELGLKSITADAPNQ